MGLLRPSRVPGSGLSRRRAQDFILPFFHESAHLFRVLLDLRRMTRHQRSSHSHWVPEEEALVEHLAASEGRYRGVPGEPEQRNAVESLRARSLIVLTDVFHQRTV